MNKLAKLLEKKSKDGQHLSGVERDAKMSVLHDLRGQAAEAMKSGLHNLKKVSVMSDSPEGLSEGLSKAKDMVSSARNPKGEAAAPEDHIAHALGESLAQEGDDAEAMSHEGSYDEQADAQGAGTHEDMDDSELDQKIAALMAEKERRSRS
jgi:hypothetical protein